MTSVWSSRLPPLVTAAATVFVLVAFPREIRANTISINGSVGGVYMSSNSIAGVFDLTSALTPSLFNQPYDIVSATMTFWFRDDADGYSYSSHTSPYTWNGFNYQRTSTSYYYDAHERASFTLADGSTASADSNYFSNNSYVTQGYDGCFGTFGCRYHYTNYYQTYYGYTGAFSLSGVLSNASLLDLSNDGILSFVIGATGDFIFDNAVLTAEVIENPVPEPGSLLLLGTGLIVAGRKLRRERSAR